MAQNLADRIKTVDPERFRFALGVYCAAAALKGPVPNPQQFGVNIVENGESAMRISFTDRPENRGMLAVKNEFPEVRDGEAGETGIHDAVINAFAMAPFRKSGTLDRRAFLALVKSEHERIEAMEAGNSGAV